jgi:hypothetical protein
MSYGDYPYKGASNAAYGAQTAAKSDLTLLLSAAIGTESQQPVVQAPNSVAPCMSGSKPVTTAPELEFSRIAMASCIPICQWMRFLWLHH